MVHIPLSGNSTYRILYVDTHGLVLLLLAIDLIQLSVLVLTVPAQLRAIPLREDKGTKRSHGRPLDAERGRRKKPTC